MLLKRFKLSAEKFRLLFSKHIQAADSTRKEFYFEVRTYLEGWLTELKIETFEQLKDLITTYQIKKKCPPDYRDHFIDDWSGIISPSELADKLDSFDSMKVGLQKKSQPPQNRNKVWVKSVSSTVEHEDTISSRKQLLSRKPITKVNNRYYAPRKQENRPPVKCYGCGTPGFIRAKYPNCTTEPKAE
ncbi:hypothetical protein AVEN_142799-1 [Araneus ventricosus]|uniref:CCHC-type domain-containing protein n=1 Tax=Araneus ventricosus TaxID=182803 RepID=A0A4Y2L4J9_ARAVE|nr:hypothetical protein AVEN_142799-1 [Araneus ventricosus]